MYNHRFSSSNVWFTYRKLNHVEIPNFKFEWFSVFFPRHMSFESFRLFRWLTAGRSLTQQWRKNSSLFRLVSYLVDLWYYVLQRENVTWSQRRTNICIIYYTPYKTEKTNIFKRIQKKVCYYLVFRYHKSRSHRKRKLKYERSIRHVHFDWT